MWRITGSYLQSCSCSSFIFSFFGCCSGEESISEKETATASAYIDGALQDVELLGQYFLNDKDLSKFLQTGLRNLRTFLLYARGNSRMGSLLSRVEDSLIQDCKDFHNLCLRQKENRFHSMDMSYCLSEKGLIQLANCIGSFSQEIIKSYITLLDYCSWQSAYQFKEFFASLLVNMADMMRDPCFSTCQEPNLIDAFKDKLVFFINFIRFAELRGSEPCELHVLLTRLNFVAVNAARLCYKWTMIQYNYASRLYAKGTYSYAAKFSDKFQLEFSDLLLKIKPVDPQIREIYVHVLMALNVSRSSHALTQEVDKHVLGDFIDSLLCQIVEALSCGGSCMVSLKDQVPILYDGLRFLRTILTKHLEKIDALHKEAKDLIGAAVNEAAMVICSLPMHELEEGLLKEMDFALLNFLEKIKLIKVITSPYIFPKNNENGFIDFFLDNLKELSSCIIVPIAFAKDQIQTVQDNLVFLRSLMGSILDDCKHNGELQSLWNRVVEMAYDTHVVILSLVVRDIPNCSLMNFETIIEKISLIKLESLKIVGNHDNSDSKAQKASSTFNPLPSQCSTTAINKIVVTLYDEEKKIKEHLTSGSEKLDIISIVGMSGLGKTTLARSVYDNPSVRDLFHTSAWCDVSQVYKKKNLLLQILVCVDLNFSGDKYSEENEQGLEEKLKKCLLRRRYLIVLDDVWDFEAWSCLKRSFPDDANSSRILLTSRDSEVAKKINPCREPHPLRRLTYNECWDLLQKKLSCIKSYSVDLGKKIARNCHGLPLTVVIIAGILANSDQDGWEWIAGRLSLTALSNIDQCMDILELSFRKLPKNLKSCFLYFGLFPEDVEIPVKKLIWFWIAEGFIEKCEQKSLENVAKDYMNDLIGRNLVMVSKVRFTGGVKTCRIHDLLHEFCVVKAKRVKFLSLLNGHDELFTFLGQRDLHRLSVHSNPQDFEKSKLSCPGLRSLLFFAEGYDRDHYHISFIFHFSKHLKVLDLPKINLGSTFPNEITLLLELRYLGIRGTFKSIPSAVANLSSLETLLIYAAYNILLPNTIWNMLKLRVLWSFGYFLLNDLATDNLENSSYLNNLDTFSTLKPFFGQSLEKIMRKLPNIRSLKCESGKSNADCNGIVVMDFLSQLESLHLRFSEMNKYHIGFSFPLNLKKLHLSESHSCIIPKGEELPNLVVLKLDKIVFEGGAWDMNEEFEFPNLKYLELDDLMISRWTGIDGIDHFPCLEKLVLHRCWKVKEVPSCLGDTTTLQMIEVSGCRKSVVSLIMQIKESQKDNWGNEDLQVLLKNIIDDEVERVKNEMMMTSSDEE